MKRVAVLFLSLVLIASLMFPMCAESTNNGGIFRYAQTVLSEVEDGQAITVVYNALVEEVPDLTTEIKFANADNISDSSVYIALNAFINDYPEYFWFDCNNYSASFYGDTGNVRTLKLVYVFKKAEMPSAMFDFNTAVNKAMQEIDDGMSDYEKEKALHDYLAKTVDYGSYYDEILSHTIYGALVQRVAVCDGYSKALSYLCGLCGIKCHIVSGQSINPMTHEYEDHAWNIVYIDKNWYYVDNTWDTQNNGIFYHYFNNNNIGNTHIPEDVGYPLPVLNQDAPSYYDVHGVKLDTLSVDSIVTLLQENDYLVQMMYDYDTTFIKWIQLNDQENFYAILKKLGIYGRVSLEYYAMENECIFGVTFDRKINFSGKVEGLSGEAKATVDLISDGSIVAQTLTDEDGNYTIPDVQAGEYTVRASCDGYSSSEKKLSICSSNSKCRLEIFQNGDVNSDGNVDNLDLVRIKKYLVSYNVYVLPSATDLDTSTNYSGYTIIDNLDVLKLKKILVGYTL